MKKGLILIFILFMVYNVQGLPPTYHQFYGDAGGERIIAIVDNSSSYGIITDGQYGYDPLFLVENGQDGDIINFFIDDVKKTEYIFEDGAATKLDFIVEDTTPRNTGGGNTFVEDVTNPISEEPEELPDKQLENFDMVVAGVILFILYKLR